MDGNATFSATGCLIVDNGETNPFISSIDFPYNLFKGSGIEVTSNSIKFFCRFFVGEILC